METTTKNSHSTTHRTRRVYHTKNDQHNTHKKINKQPTQKARTSFSRFRAEDKKLKIMVLGGLEEVGRNCTLIEYDGDIIFIDMGLQFPEEDMPRN